MEEKRNTVLLVEDDFDLKETISEFLGKEGFEVILAENGSQGIQKAIQYRPDVIVCDITMPGITGYEVFNMLHQINTTSVIPFIFLSAKATKEDILLGLHLGADDYIPKPFEFSDLVNILRNRIENRKKIIEVNDEKFDALLNNTFSGTVILNGQVIEHVNKHFAEMLGYFQEELIGNNLINFVHKDDICTVVDNISRCEHGAVKDFKVIFKAIHKNNNLVDLCFKGSNVIFKGEKRIVSSCSIDMAESDDNHDFSKKIGQVKLTVREIEILTLICQGLSNAQIAAKLFLSERTIEGHRARLFDKTGTNSAVALAMWAVKNKIIKI
ncbi:MAG: response regulator [Bacteroidales bacterium]